MLRLWAPYRSDESIKTCIKRSLMDSRTLASVHRWYKLKTSTDQPEVSVDATATLQWDLNPDIFLSRPPWYRLRGILITVPFTYLVLRHSFEEPMKRMLQYLIADERAVPSCYLVGYLVVLREVSTLVTITLCSALLGWDISRSFINVEMDAFYFLLMSRRDLSQYYKLLNTNTFGTRKLDDEQDTRLAFFHKFMSIYVGQRDARHTTGLRLKPHRSLADREHLQQVYSVVNCLVDLYFVVSIPSFLLTFIFYLSNDIDYVWRYPGCDLELERLIAKEQAALTEQPLVYYSFHLRSHKMLTMPIDFFFNIVFWFHCWFFSVKAVPLGLMMEYDIYRYWLQVYNRARELDASLDSGIGLSVFEFSGEDDLLVRKRSQLELMSIGGRRKFYYELAQVRMLKEELTDLFREIAKLNTALGDGLSAVAACWVTLLTAYACSVGFTKQRASFELKLTIGITLIVLAAFFASTLIIHRKLRLTFPLLCSIMAKSKAPNKRQLGLVVNLYIDGKSSFSLFRMLPINTSLGLRIISLSISTFFIINNISRYK